jgi:hypothetical protein
MSCYISYKKKELLKTADYLLKQECCNVDSCNELIDDLQDLQFKCNDAFGEINLDKDEKGNIEGTLCYQLRDKKNRILERFKNKKLGGYKKNIKKRTRKIKRSKKSKKNKRANKNKTRKTR